MSLFVIIVVVVVVHASFDPQSVLAAVRSGERMKKSQLLAMLEQEVEDYNAVLVASAPDAITACSRRRLLCLPLDERFDPPMGMFSHGHVQTGDKLSVPRVFWQAIQLSQAEVRSNQTHSHLVLVGDTIYDWFLSFHFGKKQMVYRFLG